jgi:hypothetical protein
MAAQRPSYARKQTKSCTQAFGCVGYGDSDCGFSFSVLRHHPAQQASPAASRTHPNSHGNNAAQQTFTLNLNFNTCTKFAVSSNFYTYIGFFAKLHTANTQQNKHGTDADHVKATFFSGLNWTSNFVFAYEIPAQTLTSAQNMELKLIGSPRGWPFTISQPIPTPGPTASPTPSPTPSPEPNGPWGFVLNARISNMLLPTVYPLVKDDIFLALQFRLDAPTQSYPINPNNIKVIIDTLQLQPCGISGTGDLYGGNDVLNVVAYRVGNVSGTIQNATSFSIRVDDTQYSSVTNKASKLIFIYEIPAQALINAHKLELTIAGSPKNCPITITQPIPTPTPSSTPKPTISPSPTPTPKPTPTPTPAPTSTPILPKPPKGTKTFGETNFDTAKSIAKTNDGGYILSGSYLLKVDANGNQQWNKTSTNSAIQTRDGGYVIAGTTSGAPVDISIVKLDKNGDVQWKLTYGGGATMDIPNCIIQTDDNGFMIAALTGMGGHSNGMAIKVDENGTLKWASSPMSGNLQSVIQTSDGGYALTGIHETYQASGSNLAIVKMDKDGTIQWSREYSGEANESYGYSIVQAKDGGLVVAGTKLSQAEDSDAWLIKTDIHGSLLWSRTFGGAQSDYARAVIATPDGGYAIAGSTCSYGAGQTDAWLLKTDAQGNLQWSKTYGGTNNDEAYAIVQADDGGFALAGYTESFGYGGRDMWLILTDAYGNLRQNT